MREQLNVSIEKALIKQVKAKAQGNLVTVGRFVNDLIRDELLGRKAAGAVVAVKERKPKKDCNFCEGSGKAFLANDRCPIHGDNCTVCHECMVD